MKASALDKLSPEDRGLLVGLPYRVGVWMSQNDDAEGERDDERERDALEKIIRSVARVQEGSAFVQAAVSGTLQRREKWPVWADHSFDILADCEKAAVTLKQVANSNDAKAYCQALVQIAEAVAAAHGEFGVVGQAEDDKLSSFLKKIVENLTGREEDGGFMNISPAEESALERLRTALHAG